MKKTYIAHHGIKGQKWGVRRFQNNDGSLTRQGRKRYNVNDDGTVNMKKSYRRKQNTIGAVKALVGTSKVLGSALHINNANKAGIDYQTKGGKKFLSKKVTSIVIGSVLITSSVSNFMKANSNRTFNSTGKGATPETFTGKPKTRKQVITQQNRANNKK